MLIFRLLRLAGLIGMIACSSTAFSGAYAAEIPEKYRGVYAVGESCDPLPKSESEIGEFPWLIVTKDTVYGHESACSVTAVRRNVRRNADELTFKCAAEGDDLGTHKEIWSLESETISIWGFKMSQPYLLKGTGRFQKCSLQAIPPRH